MINIVGPIKRVRISWFIWHAQFRNQLFMTEPYCIAVLAFWYQVDISTMKNNNTIPHRNTIKLNFNSIPQLIFSDCLINCDTTDPEENGNQFSYETQFLFIFFFVDFLFRFCNFEISLVYLVSKCWKRFLL